MTAPLTADELYALEALRAQPGNIEHCWVNNDTDLARLREGDALRDAAPRLLAAARREVKMREALKRSMIALDDWLNLYASDQCDATRVEEARKRINEGGTLWYIANVQRQNREALKETP